VKKKWIWIIVVLLVVAGVVAAFIFLRGEDDDGITLVEVERGEIVDKAIAIGQIDPRHEVGVKSKISGIVKEIYVEVGDRVTVGQPLIDIAPEPTPLELTQARKELEIEEVNLANARKEMDRAGDLLAGTLISQREHDESERRFEEAKLKVQLAQERLSLIEEGRTKLADRVVDSVVKAPISGTVLERMVNAGDPVVPLTPFQAGTSLFTLADMGDLLFKGTVDEIDVGRLTPGMEAAIQVGAIPETTVTGRLTRLSPKARKKDNATVFDVEVEISDAGGALLRAGYSANADVVIQKKSDILFIPERLITFRDEGPIVEVQVSHGKIEERSITVGLSDGIRIEVTEALSEGDKLVERPPKEIE